MAAFLEVDQIVKRFGAVEVLKSIDIRVEDGEFLVLVGPSGCGKSTLLNTIAGLESVSEGELRIAQLLKRKPSQLSGGQRQRVAMGRALVRKPKIFLFDEPLSNLDAKLRVEMRTEIKKLHQRLGATIVYVTHDQIEAMTLASQIAVMRGGVLQQFGTPREVYEHPANTFVAGFMGSPSMNLIPATVVEGTGGLALSIERAEGAPILLPLADGAANGAVRNYLRRPVILGLRPESITDPGAAEARTAYHHRIECL